MTRAQQDAGRNDKQTQGAPDLQPSPITLPKNRSTGNLQKGLAITPLTRSTSDHAESSQPNPRIRFSMDGGSMRERDALLKSPLVSDGEHGLGMSGLRRIRQGPSRPLSRAPSTTLSRTPTAPPSPETRFDEPLSRASSMHMHVAGARGFSVDAGSSSTVSLGLGEDLARFPIESLHSFSFVHQSEEALRNRQAILRKSVEFMRDRGWGIASHPGLLLAQAKVSGDPEVQGMVSLLSKAHLLEGDDLSRFGAMTGPVIVDGENVFEKHFVQRSESPEPLDGSVTLGSKSEQFSPKQTQPQRTESFASSSSRTTNAEEKDSRSLSPVSPPKPPVRQDGRPTMRRTYTDTKQLTLQTQLADLLAKPFNAHDPSLDSALFSPTLVPSFAKPGMTPTTAGGTTHATSRWSPASQAIFTTKAEDPWTILAANDLACLVFGVTMSEVRHLGIMEVIRADRRSWLKQRLEASGTAAALRAKNAAEVAAAKSRKASENSTSSVVNRGGITAMLLSKPNSRQQASTKRAQTEGHPTRSGMRTASTDERKESRGVLLCGDIVPIQKRNGSTGSASLWVKEKKGYLIWVLEEIVEDCANVTLDEAGKVLSANGAQRVIWGQQGAPQGKHITQLVPKMPVTSPFRKTVNYEAISDVGYFAARNSDGYNIPVTIMMKASVGELSVSSFPHMAGIIVLSAGAMEVTSSNSVFSAALFGRPNPDGLHVTDLIPQFVKVLDALIDDEQINLVDGLVIPEQSFRRARALLALREDSADAAEALFLRPAGLPAKHCDGSEIYVDVQMRIVKSQSAVPEEAIIEERDEQDSEEIGDQSSADLVYALWITYSRHLHSIGTDSKTPVLSRPPTPPRQPSPGQAVSIVQEPEVGSGTKRDLSPTSQIEYEIKEATEEPISQKPAPQQVIEIRREPHHAKSDSEATIVPDTPSTPKVKKTIDDFVIVEDMGQGAYGQVKLARYKRPPGNKVVLKYVTKKRILVDTWMRDRKLGTVPSEIHVLNFLSKDGMRHPNIVEMIDFFEDNTNYYIEMVPHGLPGMDLFDYIEMRTNMDEGEVRNIFVQVVDALHHLHVKASVVHRDIKDENIVLDGENRVKLIDFGSAAYVKNGPFDVFVGTIDYCAPEVIEGKRYRGKEQDVWALGILLYTLIYKENPFYNVDEILDHELRVPWVMSEGSIELIRAMLNRDVASRFTIEQVKEHPWVRGEEVGESD